MTDPGSAWSATNRGRVGLLALALILAIGAVYWPVRHADFNWDDDSHITINPTIVGPLGLKEIWTSGKANYFPLTMTSFWVQHALWGLKPGPYHVVTVLFHIGAALVLWRVLHRLRIPGAWLGAMVWALHPVQVESVAWICELKNTQSALFYLLAILFFVRWMQAGQARPGRDYIIAIGAALFAILSKSSTVMLPVVLGLIGWWHGHRRWRDVVWLAPFFALSLLASGWTIWEQKVNSMASGPDWDNSLAARLTIAGKVPWFYLGKLLWPEPLIFIYPRWVVHALTLADWLPLPATIALGVVLWWRRTVWPHLFLALTIFFVSLFPVLGLFDVFFFKYSFVGDHFQYLASMGPLVFIATGAVSLLARWQPAALWPRAAVGGVVLAALALMSSAQARIYLTRETLWTETVRLNPNAWIARMNLGSELMSTGRPQLALPHFEAARKLRPDDPLGEANLGAALVLLQRGAEAIPHLEKAVGTKPELVEAQNSLGVAKMRLGRLAEARGHFEAALAHNPEYHPALSNLGHCFYGEGRLAEALAQFDAASQKAPQAGSYHAGAARALLALGKPNDALPRFDAARRLDPSDHGAVQGLAEALYHLGRYAESLEFARAVLHVRPDSVEAEASAGQALFKLGRAPEALAHFETALRLNPNQPAVRTLLAAVLFQSGRPAEAVPHYAQLAEQHPSGEAFGNLGSALLQAGRKDEALQAYRRALALAPDYHEARINLAIALAGEGRAAAAAQELEQVLQRQPDHARAKDMLARLQAQAAGKK